MPTNYPAGYDNFSNPTPTNNLGDPAVLHTDQHTNVNDAVEAMQAEFGTNPSGSHATVSDRLVAIEADMVALAVALG